MTRKTKKNTDKRLGSGERTGAPAVGRPPVFGIVIGEVRITKSATHWRLGDVGRIGKIAATSE